MLRPWEVMNLPDRSRRREGGSEPIQARRRRPAAPVDAHRLAIWTVRLILAFALAFAVGYLPYRLYLRSGLAHFVALRGELSQLQARNEKLRGGIIELRLKLDRFPNSEAIEQVARDELGLVRSGEVVFKVE